MKKCLIIFLVVSIIAIMWMPTFADEGIITHQLTSDGKNSINVKKGDIIEVNYSVISNMSMSVMTMQNEIFYDSSFFELVENSNEAVTRSYNTSVQIDSKGEYYIYFNTMSTQKVNSNGMVVGTAKFKVIGSKGSTVIKNTSYKCYNSDGNQLNSATEDLTVTIDFSDYEIELISDYVVGKALILIYTDADMSKENVKYGEKSMYRLENSGYAVSGTDATYKNVYGITVDNPSGTTLTLNSVKGKIKFVDGTTNPFLNCGNKDVNGTNKIDISDAVAAMGVYNVHPIYFSETEAMGDRIILKADVNHDKKVNIEDVKFVMQK